MRTVMVASAFHIRHLLLQRWRMLEENLCTPEKTAEDEGKSIVDRIPDATTALMVIGQVEVNFFDKLNEQRSRLTNLKEFSLQGPGFNVMAAPGTDIGRKIKEFIDAYQPTVHWSDGQSNLMISSADNNKRFAALSKLNPSINAKKSKCVVSFWATAAKVYQFEGQMGDEKGFNYKRDTGDILNSLLVTGRDTATNDKHHTYMTGLKTAVEQAADSNAVLALLKEGWGNGRGILYKIFKKHPLNRAKVVAAVQDKCSNQGSRTYDELNAIEFGLRHQKRTRKIAQLGISLVADVQTNVKSKLPNFLGTGEWSGTYIGMPDPEAEDESDRKDKCHPFHEFTVDLINSLSR